MTTKLLTPKNPATIGFWQLPPVAVLGWKLGQDNAVDVMTSVNVVVAAAKYKGALYCNYDDTRGINIWEVVFTKRDYPTVTAEGNSWITFDGFTPRALDNDFVTAFYDITDAPLAPPPEPDPDPEPGPAQEETP